MRRLSPVVALVAAIAGISLFLAFSGESPAGTLALFFSRPFSSWWHFGNLLNMAALLMIASTGSALALRAGAMNLGGEAQIYAPALITALILASQRLPADHTSPAAILFFALAAFAAMLAGAALAALPALLRAKRGVSELLSSFLFSAATLPVLDYLVAGPLRDQSKNLLATPAIAKAVRLPPLLDPSLFNASFFAALAIAFGVALFLIKTKAGFRLGVTGIAPEFARFSGFPTARIAAGSLTASGALHGLAGFFSVTGTWYVCHQGHSGGMGWSALACALMAGGNPYAIIPASLVFSWLETASDSALLSTRFSFDSTSIVQAILLLMISAKFMSTRLPRTRLPRTRLPRTRGHLSGTEGDR